MKLLSKFALLAILLSAVFGCASTDSKYETRFDPPAASFNPVFMRYNDLPGEKVMVVAVDPGGRWAYGFEHGKDTLEEAAESAAVKCDKKRKEFKVFTHAKIFAINDEVVYKSDL